MVGSHILIGCLDTSADRNLLGPGTVARCLLDPDIRIGIDYQPPGAISWYPAWLLEDEPQWVKLRIGLEDYVLTTVR